MAQTGRYENQTAEQREEEIKELLKDKLLVKRCNEFTIKALKEGISINTICVMVKDYQRKYKLIKEEGGEALAVKFTMEKYWKISYDGTNILRILV